MTPSASRKCLRVARRSERLAQTYGFIIVCAVNATAESPLAHSHPFVKELRNSFTSVFAEATGIEPNPPVRHNIRVKDDAIPEIARGLFQLERARRCQNSMREFVTRFSEVSTLIRLSRSDVRTKLFLDNFSQPAKERPTLGGKGKGKIIKF